MSEPADNLLFGGVHLYYNSLSFNENYIGTNLSKYGLITDNTAKVYSYACKNMAVYYSYKLEYMHFNYEYASQHDSVCDIRKFL